MVNDQFGSWKIDNSLKIENWKLENSRRGFTFIELVVSIGLIAILGTIGILGLARYRAAQNLKLSVSEITTVIKATQNRAITQESGKSWGIRFVNPDPDPDYYEVFRGLSYASGVVDKRYPLRRGVVFLNPPASTTIEIVFQAITGSPNQTQIIVVGTGDFVENIIVNKSGVSTSRSEGGLKGDWQFDESGGGYAYDASGNGNNGYLLSQ